MLYSIYTTSWYEIDADAKNKAWTFILRQFDPDFPRRRLPDDSMMGVQFLSTLIAAISFLTIAYSDSVLSTTDAISPGVPNANLSSNGINDSKDNVIKSKDDITAGLFVPTIASLKKPVSYEKMFMDYISVNQPVKSSIESRLKHTAEDIILHCGLTFSDSLNKCPGYQVHFYVRLLLFTEILMIILPVSFFTLCSYRSSSHYCAN